jgi:arrestin-related trafficking adapter 3/6
MSIGMFFDAMKERVRSVSRTTTEHDTPPHSLTRDGESGERRESSRRERTRERREHPALERVAEVLGLESGDDEEGGAGWKEFRKGVYTYPILFVLPPGSPPTLICEYGTVIWKLKAHAHRPGAFTTKLSAGKEVVVVACPSDDETEESENIIVERPWDTQMQYLVTISGRSFPVGGTIPFSITFAPWTKMKVFRLHVVLEGLSPVLNDSEFGADIWFFRTRGLLLGL